MAAINPVQGARKLSSVIEPLGLAKSALSLEGKTLLNAHVFTNANVSYRVGQFSSHGGFMQQKLIGGAQGSFGGSGSMNQIVNETTRRPFAIAVANIRPAPQGIKDVEAAARHLEDAVRTNPEMAAGAVLQGRDGKLALGDLVYAGHYPQANGSVTARTVMADAQDAAGHSMVGKWTHKQGNYQREAIHQISDTKRVLYNKSPLAEKIVPGQQPTIRRLDLSGEAVPRGTRDVDPGEAMHGVVGTAEEYRRKFFGGMKWKWQGDERVTVAPEKAREIIVNGQPLRPTEQNVAVGFEKLDDTIKAVVGQDGRLIFH